MVAGATVRTFERSCESRRTLRADSVHSAITDGLVAFGTNLTDNNLLDSALPHPGSVTEDELLTSHVMIVDDEEVNVCVVRKLLQ